LTYGKRFSSNEKSIQRNGSAPMDSNGGQGKSSK
jgi:hypothetical protein